ncbi:hypothetical protein M2323_002893 [Rhodoblastus acidophilus]|uniref:class I SAM-dependent methyltransferase n=1 Tax=Rhodoblastus acidophilus TaxID=1074 RepID=UPI0022248231|nr:class I SAM-dependent methyltransferase [Rhodoblastus acidophilus]MCW2284980.1 hypothetical protein [Rhodoblastus acidophilus]MCW2333956.1 hypothetical protein [Rhodoblastus acidophilus]
MEFGFLVLAREKNLLPQSAEILELGESETIALAAEAIYNNPVLVKDDAQRQQVKQRLAEIPAHYGNWPAKHAARVLYDLLFDCKRYCAVDFAGSSQAHPFDLNEPFELDGPFDVAINNGTSEHVFNQYQVFRSLHDHTKAGGVMIHWTPAFGWVNHGIFNLQPDFVYDLAHANNYEVLLSCLLTHGEIRPIDRSTDLYQLFEREQPFRNALLAFALRKRDAAPFRTPQQHQSRRG